MGVSGCQRRVGGGAQFLPGSLPGKLGFGLPVAGGGWRPGLGLGVAAAAGRAW
jgi:hypothetical protein